MRLYWILLFAFLAYRLFRVFRGGVASNRARAEADAAAEYDRVYGDSTRMTTWNDLETPHVHIDVFGDR